MKLTVYGQEYQCTYAEKSNDTVRIIDTDGQELVFGGISDIDDYVLEDGEWNESPEVKSTEELTAENKLLQQQISALTDQQSFYEDCIAEMASIVYA